MRNQCPWAVLLSAVLPLCLAAQEKPCKPTVTGHLDIFPLASTTLHTTRSVRVWLPSGYDDPANAAKKYPVIYFLDGESAFDACTAFNHDEVRADETLTELITSGRIPPVIAVGIDSASPILADGQSVDKGKARAKEYMPYPDPFQYPAMRDVQGAQLAEFFERDVMPAIASRYRALSGTSNSALWGDSYAGAAALYIAMHHPLLFDRMIVESPSFIVGNGQLLRDSESLVHVPSRIALGIGTSEVPESEFPGFNAAWVRMMTRLADNLKAVAWQPPQIQLTVTEGARHTDGDFGKRLASGLLFIYGTAPTPTPLKQ